MITPSGVGERPLRVAMLVSATGANLRTLLELRRSEPTLLDVVLVASDRRACGALDVATEAGLPVWPGDVVGPLGPGASAAADYRARLREFHDRLADRLAAFEAEQGRIDLMVLAYHRWIHGSLLTSFSGRMINQHPGDLSSLSANGTRSLVGLDPVGVALRRGDQATRTSTFLVDATHDGGPVLVQGPWVRYAGTRPVTSDDVGRHEAAQKVRSDRPALEAAIRGWAQGRFALDPDRRHADGSRVVLVDRRPTPLGGLRLGEDDAASAAGRAPALASAQSPGGVG